MQIINDYRLFKGFTGGVALTLGNFDGVHLGHKAIIGETLKIARAEKLPALLMTFEPHPVSVLQPGGAPFRITSFKQKAELLEKLGIDILLVMKFDRDFANISADEFVKDLLVRDLKTRHVIIGHDCNFGRNRGGDAAFLRAKAAEHGFGFTQLSPRGNAEPFSSTLIRNHIRKGEMREAAGLLGHPFAVLGTVIEGDKRGRTIGFPTANLELGDYVRPKFGVYAAEAKIAGTAYKSIANIGIRPTIGGEKELLEVHILDWSGDIYGREIEVEFNDFIREEKKFSDVEELKKQIAEDIAKLK